MVCYDLFGGWMDNMFKDIISQIFRFNNNISHRENWSKDQRCMLEIHQNIGYESKNVVNTLFIHQQEIG